MMFEKILRTKPWKLFSVGFGIPMLIFTSWYIFYIIKLSRIIHLPEHGHIRERAFLEINEQLVYMFPIAMLSSFFFLIWMWSSSVTFQKYLPAFIRLKTTMFKFCLLTLGFFLFGLTTGLRMILETIIRPEHLEDLDGLPHLVPIEVHMLFGMFLIGYVLLLFAQIYCMRFMAKTLKTAELSREAKLKDYLGEFILIWFWPIGIWFIQPKIMALVEEGEAREEELPEDDDEW